MTEKSRTGLRPSGVASCGRLTKCSILWTLNKTKIVKKNDTDMSDVYSNCGCGCGCGGGVSSPTVRVVSGNDLTVEALLSVYDEGKGYYAAFDLSEASDVRMRIVGTYNRVDGESVSVSGSKVSALFKAGSYGAGSYGVEITFKKGGGSFRVFERNLFEVVRDSGAASLGSTAEGGTGEGMNISVDVRSRTLRVGQVSGITDYNLLENKPSINGVTLDGDKTSGDLGLMGKGDAYTKKEVDDKLESLPSSYTKDEADEEFETKEHAAGTYQTKEKAASDLAAVTEALDAKVDKVDGKGLSTNDFTDADKARLDSALQEYTETDPTVPGWAKAAAKPTYTAKEVGALPDTTKIPSKVSELENDSGFLTQHQSLAGYAKMSDLAAKVDKVDGKGLSSNDYTADDKAKLDGIEAGAQRNAAPDAELSDESENTVENKAVKLYVDGKNLTVAEAIVSLAARLDALEGSRGLLGVATAETLDVKDVTRCRYPLVMMAHGVPAEANIPENLPEGLPWDGVPAFAGQLYINLDAGSGGLYYAVGTGSVADWKQA